MGGYRLMGFCYPKYHANRAYTELIRSKGCVALASAGYGESTHKLIKRAYVLYSKKSAGLVRQVTGSLLQLFLCEGSRVAAPKYREALVFVQLVLHRMILPASCQCLRVKVLHQGGKLSGLEHSSTCTVIAKLPHRYSQTNAHSKLGHIVRERKGVQLQPC